MNKAPTPTDIKFHSQSRELELCYASGESHRLSCEFLRVLSPSAEVRGHGKGQETLQHGKRKVSIARIEPVGHYAIQIHFDDGHDTGIYSWDYLYDLCQNQKAYWDDYLKLLHEAGKSRDDDVQVIRLGN